RAKPVIGPVGIGTYAAPGTPINDVDCSGSRAVGAAACSRPDSALPRAGSRPIAGRAVPLRASVGSRRGNFVSATSVVGLQWGDEAKGKIVDLLTDEHDIVVRYQGGNNAG